MGFSDQQKIMASPISGRGEEEEKEEREEEEGKEEKEEEEDRWFEPIYKKIIFLNKRSMNCKHKW